MITRPVFKMTKYYRWLIIASFAALTSEQVKLLLDVFYEELFRINPALASMFKNLGKQKEMLGAFLAGIIAVLMEMPDAKIDEIISLGERHVKYGVKAEHYPQVGQALVFALGKTFVSIFDEAPAQLVEAWTQFALFNFEAMQYGAEKVA